ncbi:dTDP-4-dehydrorhamnose reductase [Salinisphaera sp. C84B14]|uniref:dTDP-4-dehydrorhamnose reductase n=1 Tax=Salinisphaera sp. C84B14 TaxID=1304155 RepID=UPI003342DAEB
MTRLLLIGRNGQVATALREQAPQHPDFELDVLARPEIDLAEAEGLARQVAERRPAIVVNAAAYTAVDRAESEPDLAGRINAQAVGELAAGAQAAGAAFIHLSTDYVFDGTGTHAWTPDDATAPLGVYGRTKRAGEQAAIARCDRTLIIRTAWVFSPFGRNFVKTMLGLGAQRDTLHVVADQYGNPTSAIDIARGVWAAATALAQGRDEGYGIFHLVGENATNWADFAREIFRQAGLGGRTGVEVISIPSADYPTPAERPANSRLDASDFHRVFGFRCARWQDALAEVLRRLDEPPYGA